MPQKDYFEAPSFSKYLTPVFKQRDPCFPVSTDICWSFQGVLNGQLLKYLKNTHHAFHLLYLTIYINCILQAQNYIYIDFYYYYYCPYFYFAAAAALRVAAGKGRVQCACAVYSMPWDMKGQQSFNRDGNMNLGTHI